MLTTQRGTDSFPLTRSEMTCFAGSLPPVWKFWTTPPLPRSFTIPLEPFFPWYLVSSCISHSPLWVAHSPWPWLGPSPHWNCPPPLSSSSTKHTSPQIQLKKKQLGYLPILYCWAPSLSWFWCTQHPPGCPLPFPILSRSCQGLFLLWPPWSFPRSLVVPGSGICSSGTTEGPLRGTPIWVAPPQIHRCFS